MTTWKQDLEAAYARLDDNLFHQAIEKIERRERGLLFNLKELLHAMEIEIDDPELGTSRIMGRTKKMLIEAGQ